MTCSVIRRGTRYRRLRLIGTLAAMAVLQGCSATVETRNTSIDGLLVSGNYRAAAELAETRLAYPSAKSGERSPVVLRERNVLDHLEAAEAWRLSGDPLRAIEHFDAAEHSLRGIEDVGGGVLAARQAGAVLLGDGSMPYLPSPSEAVLINYYKAIAFLEVGDPDNARVELNRSEERTRRAVERYQKEITEATAEVATQGVEAVPTDSVMGTYFPEMRRWESYESFVLPPAVYLQALFLGITGSGTDLERARNLMQRVAAITRNPVVVEDYQRLGQGLLCPEADCVWVIAEHGLGPQLVERRFDLPLPTSDGVVLLSLALPALESRTPRSTPSFVLHAANGPVTLSTLATMDQVVQTEFEKRFPGMVMRAVAGAVVKAVAQEEAYKQGGLLAGLIANIVTLATTNADLRMWRSMPGVFSVARFERGTEERLVLRSSVGEQWIELNGNGPMIVHIKQLNLTAQPVVTVLANLSDRRI
jgi:hypothetical protein